MDLPAYIADPARKTALAQKLETSPTYLYQLATGWKGRKPSPEFARRVETATRELGGDVVTCEELLPDVAWTRNEAGEVTGYHVALRAA